MSYELALPLILVFSIGSLFVAGYLMPWVLKRDTGTAAMQAISNAIKEGAEAFLRRQNTTIGILAAAAGRGHLPALRLRPRPPRLRPGPDGPAAGLLDDPLLRPRRGLLGHRRLRRHVDLDPHEHPDRLGGPHVAERRAPDGAARRRRLGPLRRRHVALRRRRPLLAREPVHRGPAGADPAPDRRLRLRRVVRGALRAARRRHLHQGRRRRRRPRRQGRGRHPGGRPAQPGRHRGPRRRQRRRLRRPRRRPLRVDRGREHRRHDPRRHARRVPRQAGHGLLRRHRRRHALPPRRPRLRPARLDRRDLRREDARGRRPDDGPEPRLLHHLVSRDRRLLRGDEVAPLQRRATPTPGGSTSSAA